MKSLELLLECNKHIRNIICMYVYLKYSIYCMYVAELETAWVTIIDPLIHWFTQNAFDYHQIKYYLQAVY